MISVFRIAGEFLVSELAQKAKGFFCAAFESVDGGDGAIEIPTFSDVEVGRKRMELWRHLPFNPGVRIRWLYKEAVELGFQLFSDVECRVLFFFNQARRDDYVGVNGPEGAAKFLGSKVPPMLGFPHRVFVSDDEGGRHFVTELDQVVFGKAAENESNVALCEGGGDVGNALVEKAIMAEIGVRIERHRREVGDDGLTECVGGLHGDVERGIVDAALRTLHPVNNAQSVQVGRALAANANAGSGS